MPPVDLRRVDFAELELQQASRRFLDSLDRFRHEGGLAILNAVLSHGLGRTLDPHGTKPLTVTPDADGAMHALILSAVTGERELDPAFAVAPVVEWRMGEASRRCAVVNRAQLRRALDQADVREALDIADGADLDAMVEMLCTPERLEACLEDVRKRGVLFGYDPVSAGDYADASTADAVATRLRADPSVEPGVLRQAQAQADEAWARMGAHEQDILRAFGAQHPLHPDWAIGSLSVRGDPRRWADARAETERVDASMQALHAEAGARASAPLAYADSIVGWVLRRLTRWVDESPA